MGRQGLPRGRNYLAALAHGGELRARLRKLGSEQAAAARYERALAARR